MLGRTLDASYAETIRRDLTTVTAARLSATALYRYIGPFLAVVARGLDVSVSELGVALTVAQVTGFASPFIGHLVDGVPRRRTITLGLVGVSIGGLLCAASNGVVLFTCGLLTISTFNLVLVVAVGSWIADQVPFQQRSRVVGLNEMSWALGLLIGVSTMGLVTAVTSWRWAYAFAAAAAAFVVVIVWLRLDESPGVASTQERRSKGPTVSARLTRSGWLAVLGALGLMAASESLFVTFGPWLKDEFAASDAALAGVTFGLGALELTASGLSATRTDRWGKERSVMRGAAVMVVAALVFTTVDQWAVPGMIVIAVFIASFEFSIVSAIPIGGELFAGRPGRGLGMIMAASTIGRAVTTIPTTWLYDHVGISASALLAAGWAVVAATMMTLRHRLRS